MRAQLTRLAAAALLCCLVGAQPAVPQSIEYRYDALGRVASVIYPGGQTIIYSYDAAGNRTTHVVQATTGNRQPNAVDDLKSWLDGVGTLTFDPRTNDRDPEAQAITVVGAGAPQYGTSSYTSTSLSYVAPNTHIVEKDSFSYTIQDTGGERDSAVVTVDLGNLPPVAVNDAITTAPNTPKVFDPRANDSDPGNDPIAITATTTPAHGATSFTGTSITYTPTAGYTGSDSFSYTISDGDGGSAGATVNATVQGANNPPTAANDSMVAFLEGGGTGPINACANDTDPDGDPLTIIAITQPSRGSASYTGCSVNYIVGGFGEGWTSFTYTISDGRGGTSTATVNVEIMHNF